MTKVKIRHIKPEDNNEVGQMIQEVLEGENAPKAGTAYADKVLFSLFEFYDHPRMAYFVLEKDAQIIGSAGIGTLAGHTGICELQKMYFLKEARGQGLAAKMMKICLDFAREQGFTKCYLETLPSMKAAQRLYLKTGFNYIDKRLGSTGHYACDVWMMKDL